jgi:hypothetical protein
MGIIKYNIRGNFMRRVNTNQSLSNIVAFPKNINYNSIPEFLDKLVENGKLTVSVLYDFINSEYLQVRWETVVALVGTGVFIGCTQHQENGKYCICR